MAEIVSYGELKNKIEYLRSKKKDLVVVATNGCFDILHVGHVRSLQKAKKLGDILVVGLNSDESVKKLKGSGRPVNNENARLEVLAALEVVDFVSIFNEKTAVKFLEILKPDIYVKGKDYDLNDIPEAKLVKNYGGKVVQIPLVPEYSTTSLISKIKNV